MSLGVLGAALGVLGGCAATLRMYPGPTRPPTEVAIVRVHKTVLGPACYVQFANGEEVTGFWEAAYDVYPILELPPGEHRLSVAMRDTGFFTSAASVENCLITLHAEAGHTYEVHCERESDQWRSWASDVAGGTARTPCLFVGLGTPAP